MVLDVAVDIRKDSAIYCQYVAVELNPENERQLWIPLGLAHGFLVLSDSAEFLYKTTDYYAPAAERCIRRDDPQLVIPWPLRVPPLVSAKDVEGIAFADL